MAFLSIASYLISFIILAFVLPNLRHINDFHICGITFTAIGFANLGHELWSHADYIVTNPLQYGINILPLAVGIMFVAYAFYLERKESNGNS